MDRLCVALNNSCRGSCLNHKWNSRFTAAFFIFYLHVFLANKLSGKQSGDGPKKEKPGNDKLAGEAPRGRRIVALRNISRQSFSDRLCVAIKTKNKKNSACTSHIFELSPCRLTTTPLFLPVNFDQAPDELLSAIGHVIPRAQRQRQRLVFPSPP